MMKLLPIMAIALLLMGAECSAADVCTPGETQSCLCPIGELGSQACSGDDSRWGGCFCGTTPPPMSDAGTTSPPRDCISPGQVVLTCGCWGYAYEGEIQSSNRCCSGRAFATAAGCYGSCSGDGYSWGNICL